MFIYDIMVSKKSSNQWMILSGGGPVQDIQQHTAAYSQLLKFAVDTYFFR